jgi:transposase
MKPTDEYKEAIANAITFKYDNPSENQVTGARIYHVNANTMKSRLQREQQHTSAPLKQYGGQNKVLSEAQVTAIYKYVEDSYLGGYNITKSMVFAVIRYLKVS